MISKAKIRADGGKLARYLMTGEPGEDAQLVEMRSLERFGSNPATAFDRMEQWAGENTRCRMPFFHGHIRLAPGERLEDGQWMAVVDRVEKRLGFTGQPRIVSFHIDVATGDKHLHAAWFRVDLETQRAIDPGMFKNHLKQLSRTLEKEFGLRELSNQRQPEDRARIADRNEVEESRRLGTDVRAIRTSILDCFEQSDSGKAFKAALDAKGLLLANGERRDCFVVVDPAGGHHALNKKLTGLTLAAIRERLSDLDRSQLPGVEQAQAMQAARPQPARSEAQIERQADEAHRQAPGLGDTPPVFAAGFVPPGHIEARESPEAQQRRAPEPGAQLSADAKEATADRRPGAENIGGERVEALAGGRELGQTGQVAEQAVHEASEAAQHAVGVAGRAASGIANAIGDAIEGIFDFFAGGPPKLTPSQARDKARADAEARDARAVDAALQKQEATRDWQQYEQKKAQQEKDLSFAARYGTPPTREANIGREHDQDRERERE